MISSLVVWGLLQSVPVPAATGAAAYFPLTQGLKRRYVVEQDRRKGEYTEEVKGIGVFGEREGAKVTLIVDGQRLGQTYYQVLEDTVSVLANDPKYPLPVPRPVFMMPGETGATWNWKGDDNGVKIVLYGSSKRGKPAKYLGETRATVDVILDVDVDPGPFVTKVRQVSRYAEGLGLVEMLEETKTKKTSMKRTTKLAAIDAPGGNS